MCLDAYLLNPEKYIQLENITKINRNIHWSVSQKKQ